MNEITFHKLKSNEPTEMDIMAVKNVFPEFDRKVIIESLLKMII